MRINQNLLCLLAVLWLSPFSAAADIREYTLLIGYETVNYTGKPVQAMTINGAIPGPTLHFNLGDTARIHVKNTMDVNTSIHWHGILLPNREDGVPYLTTPPIKPGTTYTYEFPITHAGTYWYHSHTGLQEQRGVYGSIVIAPPNEAKKFDKEFPHKHCNLLPKWRPHLSRSCEINAFVLLLQTMLLPRS